MARRVDRLFRIIQLLRRGRVVTAEDIAGELEVSVRTVYRDIDHLSTSGVPVQGEKGVGFRLLKGFELPPLNFEAEELRALVLGARMVATSADDALASAARRALERIDAQLDTVGRAIVDDVSLYVPAIFVPAAERALVAELRGALEARCKVLLDYRDQSGAPTSRRVRPLGLFFIRGRWYLGAWCEMRSDFRTFQLGRIAGMHALEELVEPETPDVRAFMAHQAASAPRRPPLAGAVSPAACASPSAGSTPACFPASVAPSPTIDRAGDLN